MATTNQPLPYGSSHNGARCVNAQPGSFGHECGKPAKWIGTKPSGFTACYCNECKAAGYEARNVETWKAIT